MTVKTHTPEVKQRISATQKKIWADRKAKQEALLVRGTVVDSVSLSNVLNQAGAKTIPVDNSESIVDVVRRDTYYTGFTNFTPDKIQSFLDVTKTGRMRDFIRMCDALRLRDAHLSAAIAARKSGITSRKLIVKSKDQTNETLVQTADLIQKNLDALPVNIILDHLLEATYTGLTVAELLWDYDILTNSYYVSEVIPTSTAKFSYDPELNIFIDDPQSSTEYNGHLLSEFPHRFLTHEPKEISPYSNMDGLMRIAAYYVFFKMTSIMYTTAGLAKFAFPPVVCTVPENTQAGTIASIKTQVEQFNSDAVAVVKAGVTFTPLVMGTNGDASYMNFIDYLDKQLSKLILRGTMTLDDGSSRSQAEIHERGEAVIVQADAEKLLRTLKTQLIRSWVQVNEHLFPSLSVDYVCENLELELDGINRIPGPPIEMVKSAVELALTSGLRPTQEAIQDLLLGLGIATEVIPEKPEAETLAVNYTAPEAGQTWKDTEDGNRLQVTAVDEKFVYFLDLDGPNPSRQYKWTNASFRERAMYTGPAESSSTEST